MNDLLRRAMFVAWLSIALVQSNLGWSAPPAAVAEKPTATTASGIQGQRMLSAGHSFHVFMPRILEDIAKQAGVKDHKQVALSSIGGSRVIQHWDRPADQNVAKKALETGEVDVFTMSPIYLPDDGIEKFVDLAVEKNPKIRIYVQEFWLPFDMFEPTFKVRPKEVDHNAPTKESLREMHAPYFKMIEDHVSELNKKLGKQTIFVTPVGQAVIALREKILDGKAPGLKQQQDLFTDAIGHAKPPLQALVAYCHYATVYGKSPVGLPKPAVLGGADSPYSDELNKLLQELAWQAAIEHPMSGVKAAK